MDPNKLIERLEEIGRTLSQKPDALALIGLGSAGVERNRMDEYSDLDFFVVVEPGAKTRYLHSLNWLEALCPISYHFQNTADGYKLLFADGIFCEFAIFEPAELQTAAFAAGQFVWKRDDVPQTWSSPPTPPLPAEKRTPDWLLGEALTNLYVGMGRERRGEKLSAMRFIQSYAVDRLLELTEHIETPQNTPRDPFSNERRFEQRHPQTARQLPEWAQGYARNRESALGILEFLEAHFQVNPAMAAAIRALCG